MGTNETIKQAVMVELGVAIISAHTIVSELEAGRLVTLALDGMPIRRAWYLIGLADTEMSPVAAAFHKFLLALQGLFPGHPERASTMAAIPSARGCAAFGLTLEGRSARTELEPDLACLRNRPPGGIDAVGANIFARNATITHS